MRRKRDDLVVGPRFELSFSAVVHRQSIQAMSIVCAYQFEIRPADLAAKECFAVVRDEVASSIRGVFRRFKVPEPQLDYSGTTESLPANHKIWTRQQASETSALARLVWEFPQGEDPTLAFAVLLRPGM